jgi:hypothetical protein
MSKRRSRPSTKHRRDAPRQRATVATGTHPPSTRVARQATRRRPPPARPRKPARWVPWAAIGAVLVALAAMVVLFVTRNPSRSSSGRGSATAVTKATTVSPATLAQIGVPNDIKPPAHLPAGTPPVTIDGKAVLTYVGAEYCPFCAAERWPVVVALSRFGTFSDLGTTTSAPKPEAYPNTSTFSFHGSSYASSYLVFSPVETETNLHAPLDTPTAQQQQLFATFDTKQYVGNDGGIPFVMVGNLYAWAGASYDPGILEGMSFDQIADQLDEPNSPVAQAIDGSANQITAMICQLTGNQPATACSAPYVQQWQAKLQGG